LGHAAFIERLETLFVIDFDDFLHPSAGAGNIDLHNRFSADCFVSCSNDCWIIGKDETWRVRGRGKRNNHVRKSQETKLSIVSVTIPIASSCIVCLAKILELPPSFGRRSPTQLPLR
jgi:hypothetical protein